MARFTKHAPGNPSDMHGIGNVQSSRAAAGVVMIAMSVTSCNPDAGLDSSNRGSGSHTATTSVENAYIVPLHLPDACAIQVGDTAKLRFTAINNRDNEAEKLLSVSTDSADAVHLSPTNGVEIAPNSSITAGESTTNAGGAGQPSLDVTLQGMRESLKPGMSVDVTFGFEMAGQIKLRTPVEACPREVRPGQ